MNSANTEWIKLSDRLPTADCPALLWDATRKHATYIDSPSGLPVSQDYTHWLPLQPPLRPKTLEDADREAFDEWCESEIIDKGRINYDRIKAAWLAARASLREELLKALQREIEGMELRTYDRLTALLKGEQ